MTHMRTMFWIYLIFNISRLLGILLAYMLNTWFSIILLLWVTHSYLVRSLRKFRVDTVRFYLPLVIFYYLWEFIVNIDMLLSDDFFEPEAIKDKQYARWGIIRFWGAMWPLICFNLLIYSMFAFIKVSEQIKADQEDNVMLGRDWSTRIARKDSYSFELVLLLSFPMWDKILLAGIILSGLNKGDLYHLAYLFFLIAYLNFPKHKLSIARWSIIYGSIFIIIKYVFTLLEIYDDGG